MPAVGVAAFAMVVPITIALLVVLAFLILSYLQTIKAYPSAGGAYIVTRDNFGLLPAQVAGVALLTDYVLTVAVSVAAGTAALGVGVLRRSRRTRCSSRSPSCCSSRTATCAASASRVGSSRSPPTSSSSTWDPAPASGCSKMSLGDLPGREHPPTGHGAVGSPATGIFMGATLYVVLHAFASGGAAVTGVEAISNGVPAFKRAVVEERPDHARDHGRHPRRDVPRPVGARGARARGAVRERHAHGHQPDRPARVRRAAPLGNVLFYALQAGTMLILVLAANTSFADFPRLASFHAEDNFMPRQLTKRGHRLVFSNGIIFLAAASIVVLIVTNAKVDRLIPLYAIGVFTSFTLSQAGMAKHHLTHREPHWRYGLFVNGIGAVLSFLVLVIIAVTKFTHGAWFIIVLVPVMVCGLVRLNRQYEGELEELEEDAPQLAAGADPAPARGDRARRPARRRCRPRDPVRRAR